MAKRLLYSSAQPISLALCEVNTSFPTATPGGARQVFRALLLFCKKLSHNVERLGADDDTQMIRALN